MSDLSTSCIAETEPSFLSKSRKNSPVLGESSALPQPTSDGRLPKLFAADISLSNATLSHDDTLYTAGGVPSLSGRSSPEQRRRTRKGERSLWMPRLFTAASSSLLSTDAKYKKHAAQVDRCLQSFESVNEWADFIAFLSRLLKVSPYMRQQS